MVVILLQKVNFVPFPQPWVEYCLYYLLFEKPLEEEKLLWNQLTTLKSVSKLKKWYFVFLYDTLFRHPGQHWLLILILWALLMTQSRATQGSVAHAWDQWCTHSPRSGVKVAELEAIGTGKWLSSVTFGSHLHY